MKRKAVIILLCLLLASEARASNVGKLFLDGDYSRAILEADRVIASNASRSEREDAYYLKALSLLKQRDYRDARKGFTAVLSDFPRGSHAFDAEVGIGDTYYLEGDYANAIKSYDGAISAFSSNKNSSIVYYRLGQSYNQRGDAAKARQYFDKVRSAAPLGFEARTIPPISEQESDNSCVASKGYYSVQLGAFRAKGNAENLLNKLSARGYGELHIEQEASSDMTLYKVRAGRYPSRQKAEEVAAKLKDDGYKTKICP